MKTLKPVLLAVIAASLWVLSPSLTASELLYSQHSDNQSTYGPSQLWSASGVNSEIADDFDVVANIDRVSAGGFIWGTVNFQGVYVRVSAFGADNKPGALQREYFIAAGDPKVTFNQLSGEIDATLSPAFVASGRGSASFNIRGTRGTYTVTITNITKAGYTFDAAHSVLSKSITK